MSSYRYVRVGTMSYDVTRDGVAIGSLWRTRNGWRYRSLDGRLGESFGVSRDVAAAALASLAVGPTMPKSVAAARAAYLAEEQS